MTFSQSISTCFAKYATWEGRAQRSEFWFFTLFYVLVVIASMFIGTLVGKGGGIILLAIAIVGLILPTLAVTVRRLHDTDRSGWWYWIGVIPYIGGIVLLIFCCLEGTDGPNDYGYRNSHDGELAY